MFLFATLNQPVRHGFELSSVHLGSIGTGLVLLLFGQRLFWLFVAAMGFLTAQEFVTPLVAGNDPNLGLILSLVAGVAGALLAVFVQKFAIGLAGAIAGAYYLTRLLAASSMDPRYVWVAALVGAVIGALLLLFLFKWTLIVFSSVAGAHLIVHRLAFGAGLVGAIFLVLAVVGIFFQGRQARPA